MRTFLGSETYLRSSDSIESNFAGPEIKPPLPFPLLIIMLPLLIIMAFLVAIFKLFKKDSPI